MKLPQSQSVTLVTKTVSSSLAIISIVLGLLTPSLSISQTSIAQTSSVNNFNKFWDVNTDKNNAQHLICGGFYNLPSSTSEDGLSLYSGENITIESDFADIARNGDSELTGNVEIIQGSRSLSADKAYFTLSPRQFQLEGNLFANDENFAVQSESGQFNPDSGDADFQNSHVIVPSLNARAFAKRLTRPSEKAIKMESGYYTTCAPDDNSWIIRASEIKLDTASGWGELKNLRLFVKDTPVFYMPYFKFPIDDQRHTGLLYPKFSSSTENGLSYAQPIYWNIHPQYDATIIPRLITKRGFALSTEFRYLTGNIDNSATYFGEGALQLSGLFKDEEHNDKNRFFNSWQHSFNQEHWGINANVEHVSDDDFINDVQPNINVSRTTYLERKAQAHLNLNYGYAQLDINRYQLLNSSSNPYSSTPHLFAQYRYPLSKQWHTELLTDIGHYQLEQDDNSRPTGSRYYAEAGIGYAFNRSAAFIKPTFKVKHLSYQLDDAFNNAKSHSIILPEFIISSGLFLDRTWQFKDLSGIQTLEPQLIYYYAADVNQSKLPIFDSTLPTFNYQQLFRDNRFAGFDRIGDNEHVSIILTSRFLKNDTGKELFTANIGQSIYTGNFNEFDGTNDKSRSLWAFKAIAEPNENWSVYSEVTWEDFRDNWQESNISMSYRKPNKYLANLGFYYTPDSDQASKQFDFSGVYNINPIVGLFAHWRRDFSEHRTMNHLFGLSYNSCCWSVRLAAGQDIEQDENNSYIRDNKVLLEFELKGVGSVGNDLQNNLSKLIKGYENHY